MFWRLLFGDDCLVGNVKRFASVLVLYLAVIQSVFSAQKIIFNMTSTGYPPYMFPEEGKPPKALCLTCWR